MLSWLAYYLLANWPTLRAALDASWAHLAGSGLLILATWTITSAQGARLLHPFGIRLPFVEHMSLQLATNLANYLPLRFGPILRIRYLLNVHDFGVPHFGSLAGIRLLVLLLASGVVGLGAELLGRLQGDSPSPQLLAVFVALSLVSIAGFVLPVPRTVRSHSVVSRAWTDAAEGFRRLTAQPRVLVDVFVLSVLQIGTTAGRIFIAYDAIGLPASTWVSIKVASLAALVQFVALAMGSLGIREAVIGFATTASGHQFSTGVFAGVIDRSLLLLLTYPLGALGLVYVNRRMRQERPDEPAAEKVETRGVRENLEPSARGR